MVALAIAWGWYDELICSAGHKNSSCHGEGRRFYFSIPDDAKGQFMFEN